MGKTLDGLLAHVIDRIALTGEYGALPSDFVKAVEGYYDDTGLPAESNEQLDTPRTDILHRQSPQPNLDRPFLEYVWQWLTKDSDIQVGERGQFQHLTLAEAGASELSTVEDNAVVQNLVLPAEANNHDRPEETVYRTRDASASPRPTRDIVHANETDIRVVPELSAHHADDVSVAPLSRGQNVNDDVPFVSLVEPCAPQGQSIQTNEMPVPRNSEARMKVPAIARHHSERLVEVRIFASEGRMWPALTGHRRDPHRVKPLDFIILSIIAASGPKGIVQHEIVRISGQDKRSLPHRTDRLHEAGYIEKRRVTVLLREGSGSKKLHTSLCTLKRFAQLPEHHGEIERLAKEANEKVYKKQRKKKRRKNQEDASDGGADTGPDDEVSPEDGKGNEEMPTPQWIADRSISNQIYDAVDKCGTAGATLPDIRDAIFGQDYKKPVEFWAARMVDAWQVSQPLHLRHLAIVRDTVLRAKSPVYIHYTVPNFQRLVDAGHASWDAVTTISSDVHVGLHISASLDSQASLDEYGFPKLEVGNFEGYGNNATLAECAAKVELVLGTPKGKRYFAVKHPSDPRQADSIEPKSISESIPRRKKKKAIQPDQTSERLSNMASHSNLSNLEGLDEPPGRHATAVRKGVGRPRKIEVQKIPQDLDSIGFHELRDIYRSRKMAEKYQTTKIIDEIKRRINSGEKVPQAASQVLDATEVTVRQDGQDSLFSQVKAYVLHKYCGGPVPAISELEEAMNRRTNTHTRSINPRKGRPRKLPQIQFPYWPSVAAHTFRVLDQKRITTSKSVTPLFVNGQDKSFTKHQSESSYGPLPPCKEKRPRGRPKGKKTGDAELTLIDQSSEPLDARTRKLKFALPDSLLPKRNKTQKGTKRKLAEEPNFAYLPSIAAHSGSFLPPAILQLNKAKANEARFGPTSFVPYPDPQSTIQVTTAKKGRKRKVVEQSQFAYFPSIAAHSGSLLHPAILSAERPQAKKARKGPVRLIFQQEAQGAGDVVGTSLPTNNPVAAGANPSSQLLSMPQVMVRRYNEQVSELRGHQNGFFVAKSGTLKRRQDEPYGMPGIRYKVGVFRLESLKSPGWMNNLRQGSSTNVQASDRELGGAPLQDSAPCTNELSTASVYDEAATTSRTPVFRTEPSTPHGEGSHGTPVALQTKDLPRKSLLSMEMLPSPSQPPHREVMGPAMSSQVVEPTTRTEHEQPLIVTQPRSLPFSPYESPYLRLDLVTDQGDRPSLVPRKRAKSMSALADKAAKTNDSEARNIVRRHSNDQQGMIGGPERRSLASAPHSHSSTNLQTSLFMPRESSPRQSDDGFLNSSRTPRSLQAPCEESRLSCWTTLTIDKTRLAAKVTAVSQRTANPTDHSEVSTSRVPAVTRQAEGFPTPTQSGTRKPRAASANTGKIQVGRLKRTGGSTAMLRKTIVLELVQRAGGVCPGHKELAVPFTVEWNKRGQPGQPETHTIRTAINALCSAGKLRQLTFAYGTSEGLTKTKSMLTLPDIDPNDPKVREVQNEMRKIGQRSYMPKAWLFGDGEEDAETEAFNAPGATKSRTKHTEAYRRFEYHQNLVRQRREKDGIEKAKQQKNLRTLRQLLEMDAQRLNPEQNTSGAIGTETGFGKPVQRLATLSKRGRGRPYSTTRGQGPPQRLGRPSRIASDKQIQGTFSSQAIQDPIRQTWQTSSFPTAPGAPISARKPLKAQKIKQPGHFRPQSMHSLRPILPRIEPYPQVDILGSQPVDVAECSSPDASSSDDSDSEEAEQPTHNRTSLHRNRSNRSHISTLRAVQASKPVSVARKKFTVRKNGLYIEGVPSYMDPKQTFHPSTGTFASSFDGKIFPASKTVSAVRKKAKATRSGFYTGKIPSYMDPKQIYHSSTGTFGSSFNGLNTVVISSQRPGNVTRSVKAYNNHLRGHRPLEDPILERSLYSIALKPRFEVDVDRLQVWEQTVPHVEDLQYPEWTFVHHYFPHCHENATPATVVMDDAKMHEVSERTGRLITKPMALYADARSKIQAPAMTRKSFHLGEKRLRDSTSSSNESEVTDGEETVHEERTQSHLVKKARPIKRRRRRGPNGQYFLSPEEEHRLWTAVIVVRCLAGGIDKRCNWGLVAKALMEDDRSLVQGRWNRIQEQYGEAIDKAEEDFQHLFAQAYLEDVLPTIDYNDLEAYPWKWLVQWAMENNEPPSTLPSLPAARSTLFIQDAFLDTPEHDMDRFYELDTGAVTRVRKAILNRHAWTQPLHEARTTQQDGETELAVAKTWVRANVVASADIYDAHLARSALGKFPEETIEKALDTLLAEKIISSSHKGRSANPNRTFLLNDHTLSRLQKTIQVTDLQRAAVFKAYLDLQFPINGCVEYSPHAQNGEVIAILNLLSHNRITLRTKDVPMNKWGQTKGSYESRLLDKTKLMCNVLILPTDKYEQGNLLLPLPVPPCKQLDQEMNIEQKIPLWYDIHGNLVSKLWEIALTAIICVISTRPGIVTADVAKSVAPMLGQWEVVWILEWVVQAGAVEQRTTAGGMRYQTKEWWWLLLADGEEDGEAFADDGAWPSVVEENDMVVDG